MERVLAFYAGDFPERERETDLSKILDCRIDQAVKRDRLFTCPAILLPTPFPLLFREAITAAMLR